jgi:site-specific DNA-methyltransferase (adenine-specific)
MSLLGQLEREYRGSKQPEPDVSPDIRMLFHANTMPQIMFIRDRLLRRDMSEWSRTEVMLAGAMAGILHGLHRRDGKSIYLSISMPNTFSMAPTYVRNYIREKELTPPDQDVFECLRDKLARLYLDNLDGPAGACFRRDASGLLGSSRIKPGSVDLIVTSPPYLDVVNYGTANWIRLWWLGIEEVSLGRGAGRRSLDAKLHHKLTYTAYRSFFSHMLKGVRRVLKPSGVGVLVIGDVANPGQRPLPLAHQLWTEVGSDSGLQLLDLIEDDLQVQNKVSRIWGDTKGQATERDCILVLAREDAGVLPTERLVDWEEPYKDGGPDAAHARLRELRRAG